MGKDTWEPVADDGQLREGERVHIREPKPGILLIKKLGVVYALENLCPHLGCPLVKGELEGYNLKCPCHDWVFDIRTGEFLQAPEIKVRVYPCRAEEGKVFIQLMG
jgi:3-phenylpropionate/trans-cinnamate dioxygenase ferredoxin subunit